MRYYLPGVLAMFHTQSEKYSIQTDEFEGTVRIRDSYLKFEQNARDEAHLKVAFGFRACKSGEWAVAAFGPDLAQASAEEQRLWTGFEIVEEDTFTATNEDPRYQKWVDRYLNGKLAC